jgi:type I restriction enzyme M protein
MGERSFRHERRGPPPGASHDLSSFREKTDFLWSLAELLRGDYKQSEYGRVILPLVVVRRLDCVLEPTKGAVLAKNAELEAKGIENVEPILKRVAGKNFQVYNASKLDFPKLLDDPDHLADNLRAYIAGFNEAARDVIGNLKFDEQIGHLDEANLLYLLIQRFCEIDLHPEAVSNVEMGYMFEELIRRFSEQSNETAGEHFTPREVVRLMVNLLFAEDDEILSKKGTVKTLYDPACGTGGMLAVADEYVRQLHPQARLEVFGQELNPESYAICRSDMMLKGHDASRIVRGNSFTEDGHADGKFDYMLSNPPFGVEWKKVETDIRKEHETLGDAGRFGAGLPRITDGSLLFLQHMISKMKPQAKGGSRIAIVFNASPLFSGGAGSGESEIRRWIIENDWLEAIIALPDQLFYNTGIFTFVWIVTDRKPEYRQGKVQLVDGRGFYRKMRRSLGDKRNELGEADIAMITRLFADFEEGENTIIVDNEAFGYRRVVVEQPLRRRFALDDDSVKALEDDKGFLKLDPPVRERVRAAIEAATGDGQVSASTDEKAFTAAVQQLVDSADGLQPKEVTGITKLIVSACAIRDPSAPTVVDAKGVPVPDPELRDYEQVPLGEEIDEYFEREVKPYLTDAWVNHSKTRVGYEIPLTRYFHRFAEPRPVEAIDAEIKALETEILEALGRISE